MSLPKNREGQKRAKIQERRSARNYGGSQNSGSGNGWVRKADMRTDNELIECKTTSKGSFNLRASELRKLWDYALVDSRIPVFEIEFANDGLCCVVLDREDYMAMRA